MLTLDNINKTYEVKKGPSVRALCDVSLSFSDTGLVFILGKSGSGKTTLLNIMGGLDRPDSGKILFRDRDLLSSSSKDLESYRREDVGFVFQDYNLIPELSVGENVSLSLELIGDASERRGKVEKALESVGLKGFYGRMPSELSGGQRQRVAISRAIVKSPSLILADEPTGALDSKTSEDLLSLLKSLSLSRLVIVVSHDRDLADKYADRIIEIADSKVVRDSLSDVPERREVKAADSKKSGGLSFKSRLRLAFSFVKVRRWRMVLTIILSFFCFGTFGVFDAAFSINTNEVISESLNTDFVDTMDIVPEKITKITDHSDYSESFKTIKYYGSKEQLNSMDKEFNLGLFPSVKKLIDYSNQLADPVGSSFRDYIIGFAEYSSACHFDLISGSLPVENGELAITDLIYENIKSRGFKYEDESGNSIEIKSADIDQNTLIGKPFIGGYKIAGIINTGFDYSKFKELKKENITNTEYLSSMKKVLNNIQDNSYSNMVFLSTKGMEFYEKNSFYYPFSNEEIILSSVGSLVLQEEYSPYRNSRAHVFFDSDKEELSKGQFLLNEKYLPYKEGVDCSFFVVDSADIPDGLSFVFDKN
ncbi:MAG: ABC transporter ATP-binding protein, partial [Bacilli bacterium]